VSTDQYAFELKATDRDDDPYYYTNWDNSKTYTVVAETREEAFKKLWALLGDAPRHRHWIAKVMSVKDVRLAAEVAQ